MNAMVRYTYLNANFRNFLEKNDGAQMGFRESVHAILN